MTPTQRASMEQALEVLKSVLCDPDGNVCWQGSYADRDIIGDALDVFSAVMAEQPAEQVGDEFVGCLEYRGNSVAYIFQKLTAYRSVIDDAWQAMRESGHPPDGKTNLAEAIKQATKAPQPAKRKPLTDEEIAALWLDSISGPLTATKFASAVIAAYERKNGIGEKT